MSKTLEIGSPKYETEIKLEIPKQNYPIPLVMD